MTKKIMMNELWPYEKIFPIEKSNERNVEPIEIYKLLKELNTESIDDQWEVSMRLKTISNYLKLCISTSVPYADHLEVQPNIDFSNISLSKLAYSPHIGLSFGHLSFVFESIAASVIESTSTQINSDLHPRVGNIKLCLQTEISAYPSFDYNHFPKNYKPLINDPNEEIDGSLVSSLYLGDNITRAKALQILDRSGFHTLESQSAITDLAPHSSTDISNLSLNYDFEALHTNSKVIKAFLDISRPLVLIHTRDRVYSGGSCHHRNSRRINHNHT